MLFFYFLKKRLVTANIADVLAEDLYRIKHDQLNNEHSWLKDTSQVMKDSSLKLLVLRTVHRSAKVRDWLENTSKNNALLPLLDCKSNTTELQFHLMKIAVLYPQYFNYDHYLNPAELSHQPLYVLQKNHTVVKSWYLWWQIVLFHR